MEKQDYEIVLYFKNN